MGSFDFDMPWVARTITHSLHFILLNWSNNKKDKIIHESRIKYVCSDPEKSRGMATLLTLTIK